MTDTARGVPDPGVAHFRLTGDLTADARGLADAAVMAEIALGALPARCDRNDVEHHRAGVISSQMRRARDRFANHHAEGILAAVGQGGSVVRDLSELCFAAAGAFPGLVPTKARLAEDLDRGLADREGHEIDQAILLRALLRSPRAGSTLVHGLLAPRPSSWALLEAFRLQDELVLPTVRLQRQGVAAHLVMANQRCLNAEDDQLVTDMETAADVALLDDRVEVVVLRGEIMIHPRYRGRRVFSAGINLRDLHGGRIQLIEFLIRREMGLLSKIVRGVRLDEESAFPHSTVAKPWIAAVESFAIGGGMQLALTTDHVIAAQDAYLRLPAAKEGLVPGVSNLRLGRAAGTRLSRQIILAGRVIRATDPEAHLLIDAVVPAEGMDAAIDGAVAAFRGPAVVANRRMLNLAEEPDEAFRLYLAEFVLVQALRLYSWDVLEKTRAFGGDT